MADHVFQKPDSGCVVCGVHAGYAHRVACKTPSKPKALKSRPAGSNRGGPRPNTNPARYRRSTRRGALR
jgi:hypothetical protein